MFTGLIEEIGSMRRIRKEGQAMVLTIEAKLVLEDVKLGDSIAVNGVCLTVIHFDATTFSVDVMPETFRQTNLSALQSGSRVNLERAMAANGRFGGHIVQGHVDSTGVISSRTEEENAVVYKVEPTHPDILKYIVSRGSITIDGISLTVVEATDSHFSVSIIPHTLAQTILQYKKPGDTVNLECDLMGKYVERILSFQQQSSSKRTSRINEQFLIDNGFM